MSHVLRALALLLLGVAPTVGWSATDPGSLPPVRHSLGAGVGFVGLVHVDYSRGLAEGWRLDAGLTPLLVLNVGVVGATRLLPIGTDAHAQYNLLLSGTVGGIVGMMDGTPAAGPGARIGIERVSKHVGLSVAAGGLAVVGQGLNVSPLPDVRLTLCRVWR